MVGGAGVGRARECAEVVCLSPAASGDAPMGCVRKKTTDLSFYYRSTTPLLPDKCAIHKCMTQCPGLTVQPSRKRMVSDSDPKFSPHAPPAVSHVRVRVCVYDRVKGQTDSALFYCHLSPGPSTAQSTPKSSEVPYLWDRSILVSICALLLAL